MRNTIGLKILGIVALLSLIAAAVAWVNARKAGQVETLLTSVRESYVPSYRVLTRGHIRSLEQSLYLRRLAIAKFQIPHRPSRGRAAAIFGAAEVEGSRRRTPRRP